MDPARRLRRLRDQEGYSLVELIAVLAIFLTVVAALTSLYVSGAKAELAANKRFQAQQNARLALDKLRRELHCSNGITAPDGTALPAPPATFSAIRVSLPGHCPTAGGADTSVDYELISAGSERYRLRRTSPTSEALIADHITRDDVFQYTAESATSRALVHVEFPVNIDPNEGSTDWALADDIVLRNTLREDP
jgi:prepilin-type N-terminal cleavage/methylation domain-containing protein